MLACEYMSRDNSGRFRLRPAHVWAAVAFLGVVGSAAASVPHQFTTGEALTAESLNANFAALDQRITALESALPAGTIVAYGGPSAGGNAVPDGWLLCDGSAVSRTTYANLFAAVGINFGSGDGIKTFNLPDLRGRFLRGIDDGTGRDPDASSRAASAPGGSAGDAVGSLQDAATALPSKPFATDSSGAHSHQYAAPTRNTNTDRNLGYSSQWSVDSTTEYATSSDGLHTHGVTSGGDKETRPKNVAVRYLIKT